METSSAALGASRPLIWPLHAGLHRAPPGAERACVIHAMAQPNYHSIPAASPGAPVNPRGR